MFDKSLTAREESRFLLAQKKKVGTTVDCFVIISYRGRGWERERERANMGAEERAKQTNRLETETITKTIKKKS